MTGPRLKKLRARLELTQTELANAFGVDAYTVGRWERSERAMPRGSLARMVLELVEKRIAKRDYLLRSWVHNWRLLGGGELGALALLRELLNLGGVP